MIRFVLKSLGVAVLALGFVVLNYDVAKTLDGRALHATKLGEAWYAVHPNSLLLLQPAVERYIAQWLWDPVIQTILEQPAWLALGILSLILIALGRPGKPRPGPA